MDEITVKQITYGKERPVKDDWMAKTGSLVSIRPVADEYDNKTFLGIYLGVMTTGNMVEFKDGVLHISLGHYNPAIFVPDLGKTIFGYESWWGEIESEEQLRKITDDDIQNVWYVKALKQIAESETPQP